jgi:hypothetical protein
VAFIIQKNGRVRWISDFRELNKHIKRKVYNLPKIQDILSHHSGYAFFSKLNISMQYYTFELDDASKDLCTICMLFGNYRYNRLPMGFSQRGKPPTPAVGDVVVFVQYQEHVMI